MRVCARERVCVEGGRGVERSGTCAAAAARSGALSQRSEVEGLTLDVLEIPEATEGGREEGVPPPDNIPSKLSTAIFASSARTRPQGPQLHQDPKLGTHGTGFSG